MSFFSYQDDTVVITIPSSCFVQDVLIIPTEYEKVHIIVHEKAFVRFMQLSYRGIQQIFLTAHFCATVLYEMQGKVPSSLTCAYDISVDMQPHARCALLSSVTCTGTYTLNYVVLCKENSNFFAAHCIEVKEKGMYAQHITQYHDALHATSAVYSFGVVHDDAMGQSEGKIAITSQGKGTVASHINKWLIMGSSARAFASPKLEIVPFQVKCAHGAAIEHVSGFQVLYLESRGIQKNEAENILQGAFLSQIRQFYPLWLQERLL